VCRSIALLQREVTGSKADFWMVLVLDPLIPFVSFAMVIILKILPTLFGLRLESMRCFPKTGY
jgi:hypothetical protein